MHAPHGGCQGLGLCNPSLSPVSAPAHWAFEEKRWDALTRSPQFLPCRQTYHLHREASLR